MILRGHLFSKVLEMETGITIVTPNNWLEGKNYKVAYVLHGLCGRSGDVVDYTMLPTFANDYETIFIMPEVTRSFYTDMHYGLKYFTYISEELPQMCKSIFNISSKREDTAIMGASMGGYGALKCALLKPDQYGFCCAFSSACLYLKESLDLQRTQGKSHTLKTQFGEQLLTDFYAAFGENLEWHPEDEILACAKKICQDQVKPILYMACGNQDPFKAFNRRFKEDMNPLLFDLTYEEWDGGHDWYFFNEAFRRALKKCFSR